jgi:hypothetical protein
MSTAKRAPEYDLKDAALVDLLDKHHAELRFAKFSPEIGRSAYVHFYQPKGEYGLLINRLDFGSVYPESISVQPRPGAKRSLPRDLWGRIDRPFSQAGSQEGSRYVVALELSI